MEYGPENKRGQGQLADFKNHLLQAQESSISISKKPSKRGKRLVRMKKRAPNKIQTQKGSIQEMEAEIGDPEENRDTVWACRSRIMKVKAHLEWNLASDMKSNKKSFYSSRENMGPLPNDKGHGKGWGIKPSPFWPLVVRPAFSNPRPLRPELASITARSLWQNKIN